MLNKLMYAAVIGIERLASSPDRIFVLYINVAWGRD